MAVMLRAVSPEFSFWIVDRTLGVVVAYLYREITMHPLSNLA